MAKSPPLNTVIARNLKYWMRREGCLYPNANSLGKAAGIAPNTVRNLLDPSKRTVTSEKPDGAPTLDKLEKIAEKLECEVWELLHPDIEKSLREREVYRNVQADFDRIRDKAKAAADARSPSRLTAKR